LRRYNVAGNNLRPIIEGKDGKNGEGEAASPKP